MLSVCIPVHNTNITQLLLELSRQAQVYSEQVEIIVVNDGSTMPIIEKTALLDHVKFFTHPMPLGRSAARNRLMLEAKGPYLLMLDAGSEIIQLNFIESWLNVIEHEPAEVYYGGSQYPTRPNDDSRYLRWKVSSIRESQPIEIRKKRDTSFKTNNTVINKSVFEKLQFDESIVGYGHEDTLFGFELNQLAIKVRQVDIPVMNQLKDTNEAFMNKTDAAIENLVIASQKASSRVRFQQQVRLFKTYETFRKWRLLFLLDVLGKKITKVLRRQLVKPNKFMLLLKYDVYKLLRLRQLIKGQALKSFQ